MKATGGWPGLLGLVGMVVLVASPALAQGGPAGVIEGVTMDEANQPLPGVTITIRGPGSPRTVTSDAQGRFGVELPAGTYSVAATLPGFAWLEKPEVAVVAGQTSSLTLTLKVAAREEVVVTARKREERLQDVPVAVTQLDAETIEKQAITESQDLFGRVPNLHFSQNNVIGPNQDATFLVLRGVGANPVLEPSTGLFVDGVYQSGAGFDIPFLDLERVEVLRGPQGTLFGRNTEAGAINLVTRKPGREFRGKALVEVDEQNSYRGRLALDGPITKTISAGVAGSYETTDGYLHNVTLNRDQLESTTSAGRIALRWVPSEHTELNITADGSQTKGGIQGAGVRFSDGKSYNVYDDIVRDEDRNNFGLAADFRHDFGAMTLASITGWRRTHTDAGFDVDGAATPKGNIQNINIDQYTLGEELRLQSPAKDRGLSWLLGGYAFREGNDFYFSFDYPDSTGWTDDNQFLRGATAIINTQPKRTGAAVFGQATFAFTNRVALTGGLRYSHEKTEFKVYNFLRLPVINLTRDRTRLPPGGDFKDDDTSPSVSVSVKWTPDIMTYGSVGRGFKAGGFNRAMSSGEAVIPFSSENATTYEIGLKSTSLGRRLTANAALFYTDIQDQQLLATLVIPGVNNNIPLTRIFNVGKSRSRGFEMEVAARPTPALSLTATLGYTDAEFREYTDETGRNRAGEAIPYVPDVEASATLEYRKPVSPRYDWSIFVSGRHVGEYHAGSGTEVEPSFLIPSYTLVDVELALHDKNRWKLALFARNAFDEFVRTTTIQAFFLPPSLSTQYSKVLAPRTVGANLNYRW